MTPRFLVIDDNPDGLSLIRRTLARKFPQAEIVQSTDADHAAELTGNERFKAIVAHRAGPVTGIELIKRLRTIDKEVPILMVSGIDRTKEAQEAGATMFLSYDQWLLVGNAVEQLLSSE